MVKIGGETVAASGNGLNYAVIAKRSPEDRNHIIDVRFLDKCVVPNLIEDLAALDQISAVFNEYREYFCGLWGQRNKLAVAP